MARFVAGMGRARQAMSSSWPARVNQHNSDIAEATRVFISRDDYQSQKEQWRKIQQELRSAIEVVSIKHGEAVSELALKKAELATARAQPTHAGPLATPKATPNTEPIEDSDEEDEQSHETQPSPTTQRHGGSTSTDVPPPMTSEFPVRVMAPAPSTDSRPCAIQQVDHAVAKIVQKARATSNMHKLKSTYRCSHCELTNSRCFWTIEAAMWTACKTCFNRKRPCIKSTGDVIYVLPIPGSFWEDDTFEFDNAGFYISPKGSKTNRHAKGRDALWLPDPAKV